MDTSSLRLSFTAISPSLRSSPKPYLPIRPFFFPAKTHLPLLRSQPSVGTPFNPIRSTAEATPRETMSADKSSPKVLVCDTEEDLSVELAKYTVDLSDKFIRERGAFTVVLSGGSLIKSLRKLVESPYTEKVDWTKWYVFWVDERVVPKNHEDSNYKLAYDGFLSKVHIAPGYVYSINDSLPAEGAAEDYETCLRHLVKLQVIEPSKTTGFPKFDLMLLGMGPDGHVASLFPGHPLLDENKKWVTYIKDSPKPPPERITFTFPVINSASAIAMVVTGAGKAEAVKTALGKDQTSVKLPIQMVCPEDGELTWFTDKAAMSKLEDYSSL